MPKKEMIPAHYAHGRHVAVYADAACSAKSPALRAPHVVLSTDPPSAVAPRNVASLFLTCDGRSSNCARL
eukprot:scaffold4252_cov114-Isochrysis_galbana.AAC.6